MRHRHRIGFVLLGLGLLLGSTTLAQDAVQRFRQAWNEADGPSARTRAVDLLRGTSSPEALEILCRVATSTEVHYQVSDRGLALLKAVRDPEGLAWMAEEMEDASDVAVRIALARALASMEEESVAREALLAGLQDRDWRVRSVAAGGLASHPSPEVVTDLIAALEDAEGRLAADIRRALAELTGQRHEDHAGWDSWWRARGDAFDFSAVPDDPPDTPRGTRTRELYREPIESQRVLFIIDVSGSMQVATGGEIGGASRLDQVKEELAEVIQEEISGSTQFNVVAFSDDVQAWQRSLRRGTDRNQRGAVSFVRSLSPDGGTNSHGALDLAFRDEEVDTIYFLSDGFPTSGDLIVPTEILGHVRVLNRTRNVRIHTIAFLAGDGEAFDVYEDKAAARSFMEQLAEENGGRCRVVE